MKKEDEEDEPDKKNKKKNKTKKKGMEKYFDLEDKTEQ